jgi:hypothetical protein
MGMGKVSRRYLANQVLLQERIYAHIKLKQRCIMRHDTNNDYGYPYSLSIKSMLNARRDSEITMRHTLSHTYSHVYITPQSFPSFRLKFLVLFISFLYFFFFIFSFLCLLTLIAIIGACNVGRIIRRNRILCKMGCCCKGDLGRVGDSGSSTTTD